MSTRVSNPFSYTVSKLNIYISYAIASVACGMWHAACVGGAAGAALGEHVWVAETEAAAAATLSLVTHSQSEPSATVTVCNEFREGDSNAALKPF